MKKLTIGIFDLTDCEGCELQFLALREELLKEGNDLHIINWRLGTSANSSGPFDVSFIEGSPITESDIETVKQIRHASKKVITLGTCAALGGVQASLGPRLKGQQKVYGKGYKTNSKPPRPVNYYIEVDIHLPGCPINPQELKKLLSSMLIGKKYTAPHYPVCLECKAAGNPCLFLEEGFCLGPVTQGGCNALCPSNGLRCYGCLGPTKDANLKALKKVGPKESETKKSLDLFFFTDRRNEKI